MKKWQAMLILSLSSVLVFTACGKKEVTDNVDTSINAEDLGITSESEEIVEVEEVEEELTREGMYRSELTNEWIDESIQNQRPIAVMVDNEKTALPHYGLTEYADVVYEITNSTKNDGITRFMVLVKDWAKIEQLGSVRSVRPTNLEIAPEWNAVVCHDGGPFYIDYFLPNPYVDNFSGTFSRVNNGKAREFTEYILPGDLEKNFKNKGVDIEYNQYYQGPHYQFASEAKPVDLSSDSTAITANTVKLPFYHNNPWLEYNEEDQLYYYFEYGAAHVDAGYNNAQMSFKNLLIQDARLEELDDNGYMIFHSKDVDRQGYFITNGKAIKVTWRKGEDTQPTRYYDENGNEITLNTGKTYVALVPSTDFSALEIK